MKETQVTTAPRNSSTLPQQLTKVLDRLSVESQRNSVTLSTTKSSLHGKNVLPNSGKIHLYSSAHKDIHRDELCLKRKFMRVGVEKRWFISE